MKRTIALLLWLYATVGTSVRAQTEGAGPLPADTAEVALPADSVEVSLLTCQPHDEVYSLYGHTALRYHELRPGGIDVAFNYGVFNFNAPYFVLRFVFGRTDYELGAYPYRLFLAEYRHFGSQVTEQVLNLTPDEKQQLRLLLAANMMPENATYRYNFFYNNCTTKARDIVEQCISGRVEYAGNVATTAPASTAAPTAATAPAGPAEDPVTYRKAVHRMTGGHPWAQFGNDLLLGIGADRPITQRQQEFLPATLMQHFDHARIISDGTSRPLVLLRRTAVPSGTQTVSEGFPLRPLWCGLLLLALGGAMSALQLSRRRVARWWDAALMTAVALPGTVLFLMLFSTHPTVSLNLQLLLFNPLPWFYLWPVLRRRKTRYWRLTLLLGAAFFAGSLFQSYAEGLWCLALCLLLQCCTHLAVNKQTRHQVSIKSPDR